MDRFASLSVFVHVAEEGSFSAAARRLGLSTTMVSNHVRALEDRLGARLLNRTTRRVALTEVGRAYHERCVQILAEMEEADRIATDLQTTPRGTLRLHVGTHLVPFVSPVVADFLARHPEASVDLTMGEREVSIVEEGYDLVVRATPLPDSALIVRNLSSWRHVLCCAPGYLERHPPPTRPADLARHNCLRFALYPYGTEWRFVGPGDMPGSVRVAGNLVTNSAEVLRRVALDGQGLFLGASFVVAGDLAAGRLVPVMPDWLPVPFSINAVYPHRLHLSSKVRTFIDLAVRHFAEHRAWMDPEGTARASRS